MLKFIKVEDGIYMDGSKNCIETTGSFRGGRCFEIVKCLEVEQGEQEEFEVTEDNPTIVNCCSHTEGYTTERAFYIANKKAVYFVSYVDYSAYNMEGQKMYVECAYNIDKKEFYYVQKEEEKEVNSIFEKYREE